MRLTSSPTTESNFSCQHYTVGLHSLSQEIQVEVDDTDTHSANHVSTLLSSGCSAQAIQQKLALLL